MARRRGHWRYCVAKRRMPRGLPLQIEALQSAMEEIGDNFRLTEFKPALNGNREPSPTTRSRPSNGPSAERRTTWSACRTRLKDWPNWNWAKSHQNEAARAFDALKAEGVISAALCNRLKRAQKARSAVETSMWR